MTIAYGLSAPYVRSGAGGSSDGAPGVAAGGGMTTCGGGTTAPGGDPPCLDWASTSQVIAAISTSMIQTYADAT